MPDSEQNVKREWLTYHEAGTVVGLSRGTLRKLIATEEIRAAKIGKAVRISRSSLEAYLERCSCASERASDCL